jgi:hypothetical protein
MQLNLVGRVVSKTLDDSTVVSVSFHDLTRHRKKMSPIRSAEGFAMAALSDSGEHLRLASAFFIQVKCCHHQKRLRTLIVPSGR